MQQLYTFIIVKCDIVGLKKESAKKMQSTCKFIALKRAAYAEPVSRY